MHRYRAGHLLREHEVEHERLDIAVEDNADHLGVLVDHRAAGVSADDVRGRNEVERRPHVEPALALVPARRQVERRLVLVLLRALVEPSEIGHGPHRFAVLDVTLDMAE